MSTGQAPDYEKVSHRRQTVKGIMTGIPKEYRTTACHRKSEKLFCGSRALERLKKAGWRRRWSTFPLPPLPAIALLACHIVALAEASSNLRAQ